MLQCLFQCLASSAAVHPFFSRCFRGNKFSVTKESRRAAPRRGDSVNAHDSPFSALQA